MAITENSTIDLIDNTVRQMFVDQDNSPTEEDVRSQYNQFFDVFSSFCPDIRSKKESIIEDLVRQYCIGLSITKQLGFAYTDEETKPWLAEYEGNHNNADDCWFYWKRYKNYLLRTIKWPTSAVRSVEKDTWNILDLMANPQVECPFERRGLVVAPVQSGKTANYIGLISRAADAGYKVIIVMAGVHNVLRSQTQQRLEEGFTGFNIVEQQRIEPVGVGITTPERRPISCTSREADFNKARANALKGIQTAHTNEPWLFVIKKNSNSLKQVCEWLHDNANPNDQLLLIDDEADNASINCKYRRGQSNNEPTRINGQIRNILNFFTRKCYVGYTATPYANILIDPYTKSDKYGKDLFPSSFIYTLGDSSDYFGAEKVFDDYDETNPKHLRIIEDIDEILPPKHKSSFQMEVLPESLKEAIQTFVLATTIRAIRGDATEHSTMMVNISPYKMPHRSVAWLIQDYLGELKESIKAYAALDPNTALAFSPHLKALQKTWCNEYEQAEPSEWEAIQFALYDTIKTLRVVSINSDSNDILEYGKHTEHVIAVGGYRLSRGLTLEGLVVSYYSRNAKAYDALMQMARWFGYRPGYEDLCRIWMSERSAGWYKFVADATADLFDDLRNMRQVRRTPKNYGLKIQQSPDSIIVTARNKMGTGERVKAEINLNMGFVETIAFMRDKVSIERNHLCVCRLLEKAEFFRDENQTALYRNVRVEFVQEFLAEYMNEDNCSKKSQITPVLSYIASRVIDGELTTWDIFIAQGDGAPIQLSSNTIARQEIRFPGEETTHACLVVGNKHHLSSRGVEKNGLSNAQIKEAESEFREDHKEKQNTSDAYYRRQRKNPLLVIHPVCMKFIREEKYLGSRIENKAAVWPSWQHSESVYGWSISFPHTAKDTVLVDYIYNQVALNAINTEYYEDSDENDEDD